MKTQTQIRMKYLLNNEVYRSVKDVEFIGKPVVNSFFQENIKRDKVSFGERPADNTTNQATKQTS